MISSALSSTITQLHGADGRDWLASLTALVDELSRDWGFEFREAFESNYAWVAGGVLANGSPVVLKVGVPRGEYLTEMRAAQALSGAGSAQVLLADEGRGAVLMERISPGEMLSTLYPERDEEAVEIAAEVMSSLWRPVPEGESFPTVGHWGEAFSRARSIWCGTFPMELFDAAERMFLELVGSMGPSVLLHGDLHHMNILHDSRRGWMAIDPKGVVGEPEYEVGAFMRNPDATILRSPELLMRRLDIFAERLSLDRQRLQVWSFAQAVLSAVWAIEDGGNRTGHSIPLAELLRPK